MNPRLPIPLFLLLLISVSPGSAGEANPIFAFQNGVRFPSHEKRAEVLAGLGFDGIGSASFPGNGNLPAMFSAYEAQGLRVFSFYSGGTVTAEGGEPAGGLYESIPALKDRDVILEIYLRGDRKKDLDEQAVAWLRDLAGKAEASGLEIALYPHTGMYIETLGDAVRISKKVGRDNVGVMFNLCHYLRIEPDSNLGTILEEAKPLLRQVSLSGADRGGTGWKSLIQPLGQGSYPMEPVLEILEEIGFEGPVGVQCFNIEGDPNVFLGQSIEAWRELNGRP